MRLPPTLSRRGLLAGLVLSLVLAGCGASAATVTGIDNPYAGVDWGTVLHLKACLHAHTTESDGRMEPAAVIDAYHAKGYRVLAITDHNHLTWPWTDHGRDPATLGMVAVAGNEFSSGHHRNGLFVGVPGDPGTDVGASLRRVADAGGLAQVNHPGRYDRDPQWYADLAAAEPGFVLLEVYNQGDRYPDDRKKWDAILALTMPDRPLWGSANDDSHLQGHLFKCYNTILADEATDDKVQAALAAGRSFLSHEPGGSGEAKAPDVSAVTVAGTTITLAATGQDLIEWIADGAVVATGAAVDVAPLARAGKVTAYVRARLTGPDGVTLTQPFGIRTAE